MFTSKKYLYSVQKWMVLLTPWKILSLGLDNCNQCVCINMLIANSSIYIIWKKVWCKFPDRKLQVAQRLQQLILCVLHGRGVLSGWNLYEHGLPNKNRKPCARNNRVLQKSMDITVERKIPNLAYFVEIVLFQFTTLWNKCKAQSSTFSTGNPLIQVDFVSLQVKLVTILLGWLSKVLSCWLMLHWCIRSISQCGTTCAQWSCKLALFLPVFWNIFRFRKI